MSFLLGLHFHPLPLRRPLRFLSLPALIPFSIVCNVFCRSGFFAISSYLSHFHFVLVCILQGKWMESGLWHLHGAFLRMIQRMGSNVLSGRSYPFGEPWYVLELAFPCSFFVCKAHTNQRTLNMKRKAEGEEEEEKESAGIGGFHVAWLALFMLFNCFCCISIFLFMYAFFLQIWLSSRWLLFSFRLYYLKSDLICL